MFGKLKEKLKQWTSNIAKAKGQEAKPPSETKEITSVIQKPLPETRPEEEIILKEKEIKKQEKSLEEKEQEKLRAITLAEEKEAEQETDEKQGIFSRIKAKISKVKISEQEFEVYAEELQDLLLENNVAFEVAEKIIKKLKEQIVGKELLKKEIESEIYDCFKEIVREILIDPFSILDKIKEKKKDNPSSPYIILFCGINGTGKTTTIAKIAEYLKKNNLTSILAASDTFRAASIEQIKKHGEKLNLKVISHDYGSDPAAVAFDAVAYAKKHSIDVVLIDTAGRMHTEKNLMKEIEKIVNVSKPDLKFFVGESITGNDAIEQAKAFNWAVNIDGIVLTKADIDEKGGTSLSVGYVTKKPILFLGTGQEYNAIEPFNKEKFIEKLGLKD